MRIDKITEQTSVSGYKKRTLRKKNGEAASVFTAGAARVEKGN